MSRQFSTLNQIAVDRGTDPRDLATDLARAGIEPDGELTSEKGRRTMPIYDREKIKKGLAKSLGEAAAKFAKEDQNKK
jgi:hypothetical protein